MTKKRKFPRRIYVRHEDPDNNGGYFVLEDELTPELDGETVAEYALEAVAVVNAKTEFKLKAVKQ